MQEDTQGLSPKSLIAVREGIEAARVVSMVSITLIPRPCTLDSEP